MCIFGATAQSHQRQTLFLSTIRNHQTEGPGGPAVWSTCPSTKQYGFKYGRGAVVPTLIVTAMCFIKIRGGGKRSKARSRVTEEWINAGSDFFSFGRTFRSLWFHRIPKLQNIHRDTEQPESVLLINSINYIKRLLFPSGNEYFALIIGHDHNRDEWCNGWQVAFESRSNTLHHHFIRKPLFLPLSLIFLPFMHSM